MLQVSFGQLLQVDLLLGNPLPSAGLGELRRHLARGDAVLHLGVGDGPVLLPQVKPQLALVAEMQVALLTLRGERQKPRVLNVTGGNTSVPPRQRSPHPATHCTGGWRMVRTRWGS